jgi:hypothetical protein
MHFRRMLMLHRWMQVAGGPTAATRRGCEALAQLVAKHVLLPTACLVLTLQVCFMSLVNSIDAGGTDSYWTQ